MAQRGLRTLNEGLTDVADAKSGLVGRGDAVVYDGRQIQCDVVLGHAYLLRDLDDLDLDVHLHELLRKRVHVDETWIDSASKASKLGD